MSGKHNITGIALEGRGASWIVLDAPSGAGEASVNECQFDSEVSGIISSGGEEAQQAGAKLREALGAVKGDVAVSLPSDQVLLRMLDLPTTDPAEIEGMVGLQIDKLSPFPVENMVVAHDVISRKESGVTVAGIAVRRDIVNHASELLKAASIVPTRVDVNSLVWWKLIRASGSLLDEGRQVFIIFRGPSSEFVVVRDGEPLLFRAFVRQAGQDDASFMAEICEELGYTLMSLELEHGAFHDFSVSLWYSGILDEEVLSKPRQLGGGNLESNSLDTLPGLAEGAASRCMDEEAIDLTPADLIHERGRRAFRKTLFRTLAGVGAVWLLSLGVLFGGVAVQKARLRSVQGSIAEINDAAMGVRELRRKVRTISLYTDRSRSALECLREVSIKQPSGVDLTTFHYKKADTLTIGGEASGVNLVYDFKKNMDTSSLFEGVTLDGPKRSRGKEIFELEAKLPGGEE